MNTLKILVLFSFMWSFQHRHVYKPLPQGTTPLVSIKFDNTCEKTDDGVYLFLGENGAAGSSTYSCAAAYLDWEMTPPRIQTMYTL